VDRSPDSREDSLTLDTAGGRTASAEQLRRHLAGAPPAFLEGALQNPDLGQEELVFLLRNRQAPPRLLLAIGRDPRWTRSYEIKKHLVQHPRLPLSAARNLLPHLFWKDLAELSADPRLHPVARRQAERLISTRLEELSLGERVALARRASRGLIGPLIDTREGPVLRGLLGNTRLVEMEAVRMASCACRSADLFRYLAGHPKWSLRRSVRLALLRNPRTPVAVALRLVEKLSPRDLRELAKDVKVPRIVRVGADRRLGRGT
jgi:hypothetical protein